MQNITNPEDIVLQPLNVIELNFGKDVECIVCYAVIQRQGYPNLMLLSLVSGNVAVEFPAGTTIGRLASLLKYGKPVGFYRTLGDKAKRRNRISLRKGDRTT